MNHPMEDTGHEKTTVLIVDDDPTIRRWLERVLRAAGYQVAAAANGAEAVALADKMRPAATLLDITMPSMDGIATLRELRRQGLGGAVIMLTGHGRVGTARAAMVLGAEDYITKPFDLEFLKSILRRSLEEDPERPGDPVCEC